MNKRFLIILSALVLILRLISPSFAVTEEEVDKMEKNTTAKTLEPYIVQLTSIGMGMSSCSGVLLSNEIGDATVLTCKHCVAPTFEMYADDVKVETIHTTVKEDLAYLILENRVPKKKAATIAKYQPLLESKVFMLGRPGMSLTYYKEGVIKKYTNNWGFAKLDVIGGCSGTGLFNDRSELIGIVWGAYTEGVEGESLFSPGEGGIGIGIFEPLSDIQEFLEELHKVLK